MKYSPECVAAFEAFAASNRWDIDKDEGGYYIDWSMAAALAAFAANWERARELEKENAALLKIIRDEESRQARKLLEKGDD